jgi:hypothetical protein
MTTRIFDRIEGPQHISDQWLVRDLLTATRTAYDKIQDARITAQGKAVTALTARVAVLEGVVPVPVPNPPPSPAPVPIPPPSPTPIPVPPAPSGAVLWSVPIRLDQGPEGECVGHGHAHARAALGLDIGAVTLQNPTAEKLYERAQFFDGAPPDEQSGASTGGGAKATVELGGIAAFSWCLSVADIIGGLAISPVPIGVPWYAGMMDVDADGFIHPTGTVQGGHEPCVIGYDPAVQVFTICNSWGATWGVGGVCFIHEAEFATQFANGGDAVVLHKA